MSERQLSNARVAREISTRSADEAGGLLSEAIVKPHDLLLSDGTLLLLVHGFANSKEDAKVSYRKLTSRLNSYWESRAVHVFWPGDGVESGRDRVDDSYLSRFKRLVGYPMQPERANRSAALIRDVLSVAAAQRAERKMCYGTPKDPLAIHLVAHSLGCKLTLQLLRDLKSILMGMPNGIKVRLAVLMAAAVPLYLLDNDDTHLAEAMDVPARTLIYHSRSDLVLRFLFLPGQVFESVKFALPFAASRAALGLRGIAPVAGRRDVYHTGLGHGQYWDDANMAGDIADALGAMPGPMAEPLIHSRFASKQPSPQPRELSLTGVLS